MKTKFFMMAAAALFFTACTSNDDLQIKENTQTEEEMAVGFDTYLSKNSGGQTRAPYSGGLFGATELQDNGFGIFAYQHDGDALPATAKPDFMYNQKVEYLSTSSTWSYSPIKYWPNMTKKSDSDNGVDSYTGNNAKADDCKRISFFAYAPYQETNRIKHSSGLKNGLIYTDESQTTEKAYGIYKITTRNEEGAPAIYYKVNPDLTKAEDVLWGVAPYGGIRYTAVNYNPITISYGMPLIGMIKPSTHTKMKFLFQHALTAMMMDIQLAADQVGAGAKDPDEGKDFGDGETKVYVSNITLTPKTTAIGFATEGKLSLQNTSANVPRWTQANDENFVTGSPLEIVPTPSEGQVQLPTTLSSGVGVKAETATDILGSKTQPLMFIPVYTTAGQNEVITVSITYTVETTDEGHYGTGGKVVTENTISKDVTLKSFRTGRFYQLHLVLGLTSIKIDAVANDWDVEEQNVDLPRNRY